MFLFFFYFFVTFFLVFWDGVLICLQLLGLWISDYRLLCKHGYSCQKITVCTSEVQNRKNFLNVIPWLLLYSLKREHCFYDFSPLKFVASWPLWPNIWSVYACPLCVFEGYNIQAHVVVVMIFVFHIRVTWNQYPVSC